MKILAKNLKQGFVKVLAEDPDDLWYLSQTVEQGDLVSSKTTRKLKIGDNENAKSVKKTMTLEIQVDKVQLEQGGLRISGIIMRGTEDVPQGSAHSLSIEVGSNLKIIKENWLNYQLARLKEASEAKPSKILICLHDRESAVFAKITRMGYEILSELKGNVQKKDERDSRTTDFYAECTKVLEEYDRRYELEHIILASPAFFKEDFLKQVKNSDLKKKMVLATSSSAGGSALAEVLKRDELKTVLEKDRARKEMQLVEKLKEEISTTKRAAYGIKEVEQAAKSGAVEHLLVTNSHIEKCREQGVFEQVEKAMSMTEQAGGKVHIISGDHSAARELDGLGGVGAVLRYQISF